MKDYSKTEKLLPFILAFLLPGLNFLNNSTQYENYILSELLPSWIIVSTFLIIIWFANEWLINKNVSLYFLQLSILNILIIVLFLSLISFLAPDKLETTFTFYLTTGLRLLVASAIVLTIQRSLISAKTVEKLKSENLSLKTEKYKAELDQLRKQVNPHFLFNSLSTLRSMIRGTHPNSEDFVLNLSSMYRQILQKHDKDSVTLEEEIKFLNSYIYLMQTRHEDALKIDIQINPQSFQHSIPIFSLQLLAENCFKHNIASVDKPLIIGIFQKDDVSVTVSNNYQPKEQTIDSNGLGLNNLSDRYKLLGIEKGVKIEKTENQFEVTIKLF
jgi:two-component system LytT family sensor kinase